MILILEDRVENLLNVINGVLNYVQGVVNQVWSYALHDTNRTNLNIKLILFLQLIEEIVIKKLSSAATE